jgi:hypothetical protein
MYRISRPPAISAPCNGQRVKQIGLDRAVEQQPEDRRRQEANDQQAGEALLHRVVAQPAQRLADTFTEIPADGEDGPELDDNLENLALVVGITEQAADDNQMTGR